MSRLRNTLNDFGAKVKIHKGTKTLDEVAKECGTNRHTLNILMYDSDIKRRVAEKLGFEL